MPLFVVNPRASNKRRNQSRRSEKRWIPPKSKKSPKASKTKRAGRPPGVPQSTRTNPKRKGKSMPKAKKKGVTYKGKRVYGAVAARVKKKRAAAKRKASRKKTARRKNPVRSPRSGGMVLSEKEFAHRRKQALAKKRKAKAASKKSAAARKRSQAAKKGAATRKRKAAARSRAAKKAAATRTRKPTTTKRRKKTVSKKKTKGRGKKKSAVSRKRSLAAKKAAATRKRNKLARSRRAKKAARSRKGKKGARARARRRRVPRKGYRKTRRRKAIKRYGRGVRAVAKARRTIRYTRRAGSGLAKGFLRRYRMRSNPTGAVIDTLKQAAPVALAMYGTRFLSGVVRKHSDKIPGFSALGVHAAPVTAGLLLVAGTFVTKKGRLAKMRREILLGMGLNFIDTALTTYAPASVKAYVGLGQNNEDVYSEMGEYVRTGEYVQMGDDAYAEMGDYIEVGAEEELGMMEELGVMEELGQADLQIGTGIGQPAGAGMLKSVAQRSFVGPVPSKSFVKQIPGVSQGYDSMPKLYTGIFKGGF